MIKSLKYQTDAGARIEYTGDGVEITEAALSAIIQLMDGKDLVQLANETADIQDREF